jgi:uncharacterized metal-binding protein YceD (DUF177 family)
VNNSPEMPHQATPEFSRRVDIRQADGRTITIEANEAERRALAKRFAIVGIDRLTAELIPLRVGNNVSVEGRFDAAIVQSCAVSGEDLPVAMTEALRLRFVPVRGAEQADEEIELDVDDLDEIEFEGTTFDLGEAVAQSLALAIDPFVTGPGADEARREGGLLDPDVSGPFAALASLKKS